MEGGEQYSANFNHKQNQTRIVQFFQSYFWAEAVGGGGGGDSRLSYPSPASPLLAKYNLTSRTGLTTVYSYISKILCFFLHPTEISITSAASLVCLLLVTCNSFVHQTTARHINANFRTIKFKNLLQVASELKTLAEDTIKEIVSIIQSTCVLRVIGYCN